MVAVEKEESNGMDENSICWSFCVGKLVAMGIKMYYVEMFLVESINIHGFDHQVHH